MVAGIINYMLKGNIILFYVGNIPTFVFFLQIHFLRSILRRPHTNRIPDDVPKKLRRNRNCDSCEKNTI